MTFLLWSYNIFNKNFIAVKPLDKSIANNIGAFANKSLLSIVILFIGCYCFINYIIPSTKNDLIDESRQEQTNQPSYQTYGPEAANSFEQKNLINEGNKTIKVTQANEINTKFSDVAGLVEAKDEVQDIIKFLQSPKEFGRLGAKAPKGILLYGEPGTGKTLMARAIAGESKVAFIATAGSTFDEEYVGVGAARVRKLFALARENAPCIIFIDEIDALAHKRSAHDPAWSAQTVNQLLTEMDGLDNSKNTGVILIGATNRIDAIDTAMLRPGRLDRHIKLDIPTLSERTQVLELYLSKVKTSARVNAHNIAKMTPGFSSADLANLVNEAAIFATKNNKKHIEQEDFDTAKDRLILGSKHAALNVTEQTRITTAYHEAGHALVAHLLGENHQPLYKVTITPRGPSLGHTSFEPKNDNVMINLQELEARIATQLAGRIAEEIVFGEQNITTGAENDLKNATELAYNMVTRWGYSKRIGLIYNHNSKEIVSKKVIEQEVQAIIQKSYTKAKELLRNNRVQLNILAQSLLERETLDAKDIKLILK